MVVVDGMNHTQNADGKVKDVAKVLQNAELHAEISLGEAHDKVAKHIHDFINGVDMTDDVTKAYTKYFKYLVETMKLEGNTNIMNTCDKDHTQNCVSSSPITISGQQ